jgi:diguanylate cyclase (GGDEF)-like protein
VLIADIDDFKSVNDTYGHAAGDEMLKTMARCLREATRARDIVGRYGGDEFVVIVPQCSASALVTIAERIRTLMEASAIVIDGTRRSVTTSVGGSCAETVDRHSDGVALLKIADQCLYEAKRTGRNRSLCRAVGRAELLGTRATPA